MRKTPFLLTLLASALLTACGGGGGGSSSGGTAGTNDQNQGGQNSGDQGSGEQGSGNQGSETPEAAVLTFDARPLHYVAVKVADGAWQKVPAEEYSFTSTNPGGDLQVAVARVCQENPRQLDFEVQVINLNKDLNLDLGEYCNADKTDGSVTTSFDMSVGHITNSEFNGTEYVNFFDGNQHTADVAAVTNDGGVKRLYTSANVTLNSGQPFVLGDTTELTETASTTLGSVVYHVAGSSIGLDMGRDDMVSIVPDNRRLDGDYYNVDLETDNDYYEANVEDFRGATAPDLSAYAVYNDQLTIDGAQITASIANHKDLFPAGFVEGKLFFSASTNSESEFFLYEIDDDLLQDGSFSMDIVDFESLPGFPYTLTLKVSDIAAQLSSDDFEWKMTNGVNALERGYKSISLFSQDR